jgi:hypothetical protein
MLRKSLLRGAMFWSLAPPFLKMGQKVMPPTFKRFGADDG